MPQPEDIELFDEAAYLTRYPDVALAVNRNIFPSGQVHYLNHGFFEGRIGTKILAVPKIPIDPSTCFATLHNPPIKTHAPKVFNLEKMSPDFLSMYKTLWNQDRPASEVKCHILEDVIVAGEGLVFDRAGRLFAETIHQNRSHDIEQSYKRVQKFLEKGNDGEAISGLTLLCEKSGSKNYGHWLFEMLPIAFLLRQKLAEDCFLLAPIIDNDNKMNAVINDSLAMIGIDPLRIRKSSVDDPQRYERLIVVHGLSQHGAFYSPHALQAFSHMADQVQGLGAQRIWVSRERTERRLVEEAKLCELLAARGWTIAHPGDLSLREQIALFKDAQVVAGVNGAGLTNIAFSRSGTKVISFVPTRMPDMFFWMLSQFKQQDFVEVRCDQEHEGSGEFNWQCRLMLSAEGALQYIDTVCNEAPVVDSP